MNVIQKQQLQIALAIQEAKKNGISKSVTNVSLLAAKILRHQGLNVKQTTIQRTYKSIRPSARQYYLNKARGY